MKKKVSTKFENFVGEKILEKCTEKTCKFCNMHQNDFINEKYWWNMDFVQNWFLMW